MSDIVIDADIMRSAGTSQHPHSSNARKLLDAVWDAGHRMVQCAPLKQEHDRHQGRYASLWRTKMISKKRWVHWKYEENTDLRRILDNLSVPISFPPHPPQRQHPRVARGGGRVLRGERLIITQQQNEELTTLRFWLLPMLMNGQVRVG